MFCNYVEVKSPDGRVIKRVCCACAKGMQRAERLYNKAAGTNHVFVYEDTVGELEKCEVGACTEPQR